MSRWNKTDSQTVQEKNLGETLKTKMEFRDICDIISLPYSKNRGWTLVNIVNCFYVDIFGLNRQLKRLKDGLNKTLKNITIDNLILLIPFQIGEDIQVLEVQQPTLKKYLTKLAFSILIRIPISSMLYQINIFIFTNLSLINICADV